MSDERTKSAYQKLREHTLEYERIQQERISFKDYFDYIESAQDRGISIEADDDVLIEARRAKVGRFTAHRHSPHFSGDEPHGHCDVGGGHSVAWGLSRKRRHPSKFPAQIPRDAKAAVGKVLDISADLLEAFWITDGDNKKLLFEVTRKA